MAQELSLDRVVAFLVDAPLFGDLDTTELAELVNAMQVQVLEPGAVVFREGDPGDAWYVLYDGEVEVVKRSAAGDRVIAILGRRACFGEMAILDGSPRSASVRTTTRSRVFKFPRASFTKLLADGRLAAFKLVYQIALVLVSRQRRTTSRLAEAMAAADHGELRDVLIPIVDQSAVAE